jgi:hypothetical protein
MRGQALRDLGTDRFGAFPSETRPLRWLRRGGAALVAVFVLGIVHANPAMSFGIVLPAKTHLPDSFHVVPVDDVGDTKQFNFVGSDVHRSIQIKIVLFGRQLKPKRAAFDFHGGDDFIHSEIEVGFHHVFFGVNQTRSDLSDVALGISDIYVPKLDWDGIIHIFGAAEFDAVQDNPGAVCRNKFLVRYTSGFFCGLDGFPQLIALPAKYEELEKGDNAKSASSPKKQLSEPSEPSIVHGLFILAMCIGGGLLLTLFGWQNFYNKRRLLGAALVGFGCLIGLSGLGWWWSLLL